MIRGVIGSRAIVEERRWRAVLLSSPLMLAGVIALLLGGVLIAVLMGGVYGKLGLYAGEAVIGTLSMIVILLLRQDELAVTVVFAVNLYVDWYLGVPYVWLLMTLALLYIFYLARSPQRPWIEPGVLWLWVLFLGLAIFPAIQGALTPRDTYIYYPSIVFGAFITFWLGSLLARNTTTVRRLFKILAGFGVLIAVHTIIQRTTGITLLGSSRVDAYIASESNYQLIGTNLGVDRAGSFFVQPDFNGIFFAMMIFLPLGLFVESSSFLGKVLYLAETILMLPALLFTYSASSWIAFIAGVVVFVAVVGRWSYRVLILLLIAVAAIVVLVGFPSEVSLLLEHASDAKELMDRTALWQTAIRVIQAFPLTGIGLGHLAYLLRAEPYRVPTQSIPIDHPHNSYLEWAAMAGLPVLFVFLALLSFALWQTLRNWARADVRTRTLLGAGLAAVIALSFNSWSNQGWTLSPLAALGWLILGVISSPLLTKGQHNGMLQGKSSRETKNAR